FSKTGIGERRIIDKARDQGINFIEEQRAAVGKLEL
ncbi:hypothetical protein PSYMO_37881, partial [Pseudomonas amygdali pv. mori str. 301020]